ncbi:putative RiPP precursor [Mesorhizobium sp. CU2]|nr:MULTISPECIES: putative RiPP precursor [unclassified Mesorhizobium]TPN82016.1 putative RiPP precursor [Mesorhizobium sp. CU3]TPO15500.1 putative RiPP precursor [Mesorhizobium sp. CU2]
MKKSYEKPAFVRKGKLSTIVATASTPVVLNGAG